MAIIARFMYGFYLYFLIPILVLVLIGKPRFVIKIIHFMMNIKEPIKQIKIFFFIWLACGLYSLLCLFQKYRIQAIISNLDKNAKTIDIYDSKMRELNLCERNGYMYLNFFIIMVVIDRLCDSYFKFWVEEDKKFAIEMKISAEAQTKKNN